jgi:serine/threonine protein kinase
MPPPDPPANRSPDAASETHSGSSLPGPRTTAKKQPTGILKVEGIRMKEPEDFSAAGGATHQETSTVHSAGASGQGASSSPGNSGKSTARFVLEPLSATPTSSNWTPELRSFASEQTSETSRYAIESRIAEGGMGTIHRVSDWNIQRNVAMKVLRDDKPLSQRDVLRFIQEARINGQLEHPNIVPVHELGLDKTGKPFYTMKLVQGVTLEEILEDLERGNEATRRLYPLSTLLTIFEKVCDAVAFAHSRGIIHRDLKPANIMVGEYGEVLVLDWGTAKILRSVSPGEHPSKSFRNLTEKERREGIPSLTDGVILGTPNYMAPEQVENQPVDARTDIYALGGILYCLLTLHPPHEDEAVEQMLEKIRRGNIPAPTSFNPLPSTKRLAPFRRGSPVTASQSLHHCPEGRIPESLSLIAMKALALKPEDRYKEVRDMQRDIRAYQTGFLTSVEARGLFKSLRLLIKRHRSESLLIGTGLLIILMLTAIYLLELVASERAQRVALQKQLKAEEERRLIEEKTAVERRRNWRLVFEDDFSNPDVRSRWDLQGLWEVKNGELRMWGSNDQIARLKKAIPGDVRLVFDCHEESEYLTDVSCFLGALKKPSNPASFFEGGYLLQYGGWSNRRITLRGPTGTLSNKRASPLVRGKRYHVDAQKVGDHLILIVDGQTVYDVRDTHLSHGMENAVVGLYGWQADTYYSKVRVYTRDSAISADLLETAEDFLNRGGFIEARSLYQEVMNSSCESNRIDRARQGLIRASQHIQLVEDFPSIRARLLKIWPGAILRLGNSGLIIDIQGQNVRDLGPLRGLLVSELNCSLNHITTLEPLRGMKLRYLSFSQNEVSDLEPLRGMPLVGLMFSGNQVEHLEPLRGMSLNQINCEGNRISRLEPLSGMELSELHVDNNRITSLEPLRGMLLNSLSCSQNQIQDLDPLRGMDLAVLFCNDNRILNLEPLKEMKLLALACAGNPFKSLAPFIENPPNRLYFDPDNLSQDEWRLIRERSAKNPGYATLYRDARILSDLKQKRYDRIRSFSQPYNHHHYLEIPLSVTWEEACQLCEKLNGHLATISNQEENKFLVSIHPGFWSMWIGLVSDQKGKRWVTGEPVSFQQPFDRGMYLGAFCMGTEAWYLAPPGTKAFSFCVEWDD